jgi:hypothetical protein
LLAVSGIAALALVGVVVGIIYNTRLESLRYFNHMVLAEREWSDSNVGRAE